MSPFNLASSFLSINQMGSVGSEEVMKKGNVSFRRTIRSLLSSQIPSSLKPTFSGESECHSLTGLTPPTLKYNKAEIKVSWKSLDVYLQDRSSILFLFNFLSSPFPFVDLFSIYTYSSMIYSWWIKHKVPSPCATIRSRESSCGRRIILIVLIWAPFLYR